MLLQYPALSLNIRMQDILGALERTLEEKNWKDFELASIKLVYTPFYLFNYDALVEAEVGGRPISRGFSGLMAMNAVVGELEPMLVQIMEKRPVSYEKEISHDLKYKLEPIAIKMDEVKEASQIKLAGEFNIGKNEVSTSGFRIVYWPIWRIFVELPNKTIQRIDIEGVTGYPLNFEEVPTKEKGWFEITADTLKKMKTAKGWVELSKTLARGAIKGATVTKRGGVPKVGGIASWFFRSKMGIYSLILIIILIIMLVVFLH